MNKRKKWEMHVRFVHLHVRFVHVLGSFFYFN